MTRPLACALAVAIATSLIGCATAPTAATPKITAADMTAADKAPPMPAETAPAEAAQDNPLFAQSTLTLRYPHFDKIKDSHFGPAFDRGMAEQIKEMEAIANNGEAPTFENTIVAMEKSGQLLGRSTSIFFNLTGADTNDTREKIQADYAAKLSAHQDAIALNPKLFERVKALHEKRTSLGLDAEGVRLIERYYTDFIRSGANLTEAQKTRIKEINSEMATLGTKFSQNVLGEVNASAIVVDTKAELDGFSEAQIAAAAEAARKRNLEGKYVITLLNTTGQPPLTELNNRAIRERLFKASIARGARGNEFDNTEIVSKVMRLRAERAKLMGYANHAAFVLEDETARTPKAVNDMMSKLAPAAVANAKREAADMQAVIDAEQKAKGQPTFKLEPWDWAYYAEKVRQARYNFDESQLKPYFEMNNVLENGVFFAATKLYGITFKKRTDLPLYHPDTTTYDVYDKDGKLLAVFIADMYARPSKRGGAWMNEYVSQSSLMGTQSVVGNHLNIPKPPAGEPTLMTWDEVVTMFHEFGHALHGMFSDVKYPRFSGTNVPRDFVEYPSQVNEMWADWPEVLANYAKHYKTGEPMPKALLDKVQAAAKFNQGFATTEYLAAAMLDQNWHQMTVEQVPAGKEVIAFEHNALKKDGVDFYAVPPRYRTTYFSHILGGYSAGYYAYIWSEVLDAESVEWFKENGGLSRKNGDWFRDKLLSRGGSEDAVTAFKQFRGRAPQIEPLLKRRGLTTK
jgi:peptidyl-dipeptidase Dcp